MCIENNLCFADATNLTSYLQVKEVQRGIFTWRHEKKTLAVYFNRKQFQKYVLYLYCLKCEANRVLLYEGRNKRGWSEI